MSLLLVASVLCLWFVVSRGVFINPTRRPAALTRSRAAAMMNTVADLLGHCIRFWNGQNGRRSALHSLWYKYMNASAKMPIDKVVTHEDAARVQAAEQRNSGGVAQRGGIAATLQSAADKNAASDFEPRDGQAGRIPNV
ncbi:hypothetical protein SELMODRAFT_402704 [Selaginella moellendorffii]|uniref:SMP domain-containing protein n=1 Tax=Selaginella moellendorffii TaxID=88036 RepID=D8QMS8_SELML|nr:hypothetical protein SELMODRAFT_402704 [Selaginella moellendorffii]